MKTKSWRWRLGLAAAACVAAAGIAPGHAEAKTVYVDAGVAASGNGQSLATAFKTLEEGLGAVAAEGADGTVWVAPGTYDVDSEEAWWVFDSFHGEVRGLGKASETVIRGLDSSHYGFFMITALSDVTIQGGSVVLGLSSDTADKGVIERCIVEGCSSPKEDFPIACVREIRDSLFVGNDCSRGEHVVKAQRIANSTFVGNRARYGLLPSWVYDSGDGGEVDTVDVVVANCILWDNYETTTGKLGNYEKTADDEYDEKLDEWVPTGTYLYTAMSNCCVNPNSACGWGDNDEFAGGLSDTRRGQCLIFSNPRFVDAANGDYRLAAGSPCIDTGAPAWTLAGEKDLEGNDRVSGNKPDIGCLEKEAEEEGETRTVWRFYSKVYKGHFFTISAEEKDELIVGNPNWQFEGGAYQAYTNEAEGTTALYRFYSKNYRGHFYTIDEEEMQTVRDTNPNWKYEGIAYFVYPEEVEGTVPVYRFWSKKYRHHFYTIDKAEKEDLEAHNPNWKYERIAFWALPIAESGAKAKAGKTMEAVGPADVEGGEAGDGEESEAASQSSRLRPQPSRVGRLCPRTGTAGNGVVVTTCDGSDGSAVCDGDEGTGWSPEEAGPGWVALSLAEPVEVAAVEVVGEGLPEGWRALLSEDAEAWREEMPCEARYVWVAWPEGAPVVREVRVAP